MSPACTCARPHSASSILQINNQQSPVSALDITRYTTKDRVLHQVLDWVRMGWPLGQVAPEFQSYKIRQQKISTLRGCLLWGTRVIIPLELRCHILDCPDEGFRPKLSMVA